MNRFIAIVKTAADNQDVDRLNLPAAYPIQCIEFQAESQQEAESRYPDAKVLSTEAYGGYKEAMDVFYNEAVEAAKQSGLWARLWPFS